MPTGGVFAYAVSHARARAMYSTLLTPQAWAGLCEAPDFGALIAMCRQTTYGPYLAKVDDQNLTPRRAVYQIKQRLADAYFAMIQSSPGYTRPVLTQLYHHFEIDNLKAVLRGIVTGASWEQVLYVLFPLGSLTVLPAQKMMEAGNIEAAVRELRGTPYFDTLAHSLKRYTEEHSLFPLEVALDLNYWRTLWREVNHLPKPDRTQALRIIGSLVDVNNLMWTIRYRVYHHLSEEEIINYTLSFGYRVRDEDIRALAAGADIAQVLRRIYPDLTGVDTLLQQPEHGLPEVELQLQSHVAKQCRAAFSGYPFQIGILLGYVVLTELEIQDLTVLIEAKAAHMPREQFESHLLMGRGPAVAHPVSG